MRLVKHVREVENPKMMMAMHPELNIMRGFRVKVPRSARKVYIPRKHHYARKVYTEERDSKRLEKFHDTLEPCVVVKGLNGWQPHSCKYHPLVIIEEE